MEPSNRRAQRGRHGLGQRSRRSLRGQPLQPPAHLRAALNATTVISGCPTTSSPSISPTPAAKRCAARIMASVWGEEARRDKGRAKVRAGGVSERKRQQRGGRGGSACAGHQCSRVPRALTGGLQVPLLPQVHQRRPRRGNQRAAAAAGEARRDVCGEAEEEGRGPGGGRAHSAAAGSAVCEPCTARQGQQLQPLRTTQPTYIGRRSSR